MTDYSDTKRYRTYTNGAIFDKQTGRIVANPGGGTTAITAANSGDMLRRRMEIKHEVITQAANTAAPEELKKMYGGMAWLAAIAAAQQKKAQDPGDAKATGAANFMLKELGYANPQTEEGDSFERAADVLRAIAKFARTIPAESIDGEILEETTRSKQPSYSLAENIKKRKK